MIKNSKSTTRGTHATGMTPERLNRLRECWEDGDLDLDDEEEMLDALSFYIQPEDKPKVYDPTKVVLRLNGEEIRQFHACDPKVCCDCMEDRPCGCDAIDEWIADSRKKNPPKGRAAKLIPWKKK